MIDGERSFKEKLALQIFLRKIDSIFEECSKFDERDKKVIYEIMGNLLLQRIRSAETPAPAVETPAGYGGLTEVAETDDSAGSSEHCANASVRMQRLPMVDVRAAFPE